MFKFDSGFRSQSEETMTIASHAAANLGATVAVPGRPLLLLKTTYYAIMHSGCIRRGMVFMGWILPLELSVKTQELVNYQVASCSVVFFLCRNMFFFYVLLLLLTVVVLLSLPQSI